LRLAVFTNQFPGRVSTFFARDMRGLVDAGIEIDVFPFYPLDAKLWQYVPDILNQKILPRSKVHHLTIGEFLPCTRIRSLSKLYRFLVDGVRIGAAAAGFGIDPLAKTTYVLLKAWTWAQRYGGQYDHVLAYWGNYAASCAYIFHRLAAKPTPFSIFLHAGPDLYRTPVFIRQKLLYADNIVTCSDFNHSYIREHYLDIAPIVASRIHVHHHGLDFGEFSFRENARPGNKIIAVGRLEREKGYDLLLRAVHMLKNSGSPVFLEVVGDGTQSFNLKKLSQQLDLDGSVTFRGWLPPNQTRQAISEANILVHPSAHLGDGVPNVIKESMALGTPVVASSVAGIPELLGEGEHGILVPPQDVSALADAIKRLLSDVQAQKSYATAARRYTEERFNMWRNGKQLAELLCSTKRNLIDRGLNN
jgi:glycosyltransferase involved in cell wall biosynthesis